MKFLCAANLLEQTFIACGIKEHFFYDTSSWSVIG